MVAGTVWKFSGTKTTVEFLTNSRCIFSNVEEAGNWQQNGSILEFDCNNFTLYKVVINGDIAKGTWERLKGKFSGDKQSN